MEIINKKTAFHTPWFDLISKTVHDPNDANSIDEEYYSISAKDYVTIVALTTNNELIIVKQFRPAVEDYTLELPAGYVEDNETPLEASKRELYEETGYICNNVELLGDLHPDTGRLANRQWCFFAKNVSLNKAGMENAEKGITRLLIPMDELKNYILSSKFNHALHLAAIHLALINNKIAF